MHAETSMESILMPNEKNYRRRNAPQKENGNGWHQYQGIQQAGPEIHTPTLKIIYDFRRSLSTIGVVDSATQSLRFNWFLQPRKLRSFALSHGLCRARRGAKTKTRLLPKQTSQPKALFPGDTQATTQWGKEKQQLLHRHHP